jgi:hypothetical protein
MSQLNPAKALNGERVGQTCDRYNKDVRISGLVQAYATYYQD